MVGDSSSPYWTGIPGKMSPDLVQTHYRNLIRGEQHGANGPVGPAYEIDPDHPMHEGGYDISAAPGARSMTAASRELVDLFLPVAFKAGLGQRKVAEAIGFVLTAAVDADVGRSRQQFTDFARGRGWSEKAIEVCLSFDAAIGRALAETGALPHRVAAASPPPVPTKITAAKRRAEIEALMFAANGKPNPAYWSNDALQSEYRELVRPR
jgi:hypothetical protein